MPESGSETGFAPQLDRSLVGARVPLEQIPIIDLDPFLEGDAVARKRVAQGNINLKGAPNESKQSTVGKR